jgi:UDP-N-acetylmuramoyl-tripeptide--D-alanyl-D-alanine ligase
MITLGQFLAGLGQQRTDASLGRVFEHITQDSRDARPGSLFVARRGETMDGHAFIADAVARGAAAVLAERVVDVQRPLWIADARQGTPVVPGPLDPAAVVYILAPDSQKALEQVASWRRRQLTVDVAAVTGSVGKTSTKELAAALLNRRYKVLKSERSLNTDVGMALTLLQLSAEHEKAVLEMGMYAPGEIAHLCQLAKPQYGVVTNVGPTHLERMGTIEAIAEAKAELVEALPADGVAILNADDPRVWAMRHRTKARVFGFGLTPGLDLWASDVRSRGLDGIAFTLHQGRKSAPIRLPLLGVHSVQTALAAASVGMTLGLTWQEVVTGLGQAPGRLRLVVVRAANGATVIDDSYNASPVSVVAALNVLAELDGRRIAVLGDMLELGAFEEEGHRLVGQRAKDVADVLVALGQRGRLIGEEAIRRGMAPDTVFFASSIAEAVDILRRITRAGDSILVKGSRGMKMEEIVHGLAPG